jgi:hypothetical protein
MKTVNHRLLQVLLLALCGSAAIALGDLAFGFKLPSPPDVRRESVQLAGYTTVLRVIEPSEEKVAASHGSVARFQFIPQDSSRPAVSATIATMRVRSHGDLSVGYMAHTFPGVVPMANGAAWTAVDDAPGGELHVGAAADQAVLEGCITPSGAYAVSSERLVAASGDQRRTDLSSRVRQVMGMQSPARWECVWVTLSLPSNGSAVEQLRTAWRALSSSWPAYSPWAAPSAGALNPPQTEPREGVTPRP